MLQSARLTRIGFILFILNGLLVLSVPLLRPVVAQQGTDDTNQAGPEVQVPTANPTEPNQRLHR